jgi:hypothetical protein
MMSYYTISAFVTDVRMLLQDGVAPYRYADDQLIGAFEVALGEVSRIRPDIFLDLKYQQPLRKGDIDDGVPSLPTVTATTSMNTMVPIPVKYYQPIVWYMNGYMQLFDVTDTQDQRAQAFLTKFHAHLMTLSAA